MVRDLSGSFFSPVRTAVVVGVDLEGGLTVRLSDGPEAAARCLAGLGNFDVGLEVAVTGMEDGGFLVLGAFGPARVTVDGDGRRQVIEAGQELVLRCGKASVTLTADGRIALRGTDILSRASNANRVQGGSVQLN